jgi:K+ transporter
VKSLVGESEQSPRRQEALFAAMVRNASRVTGCFRLPSEEVVEIGRQISIKKYAILNRGAKVRPQRA